MQEKQEKKPKNGQEKAHKGLKTSLEEKKEVISQEEEASKEESAELIGQLQRIQAEFENYKKRTEKEKQDIYLLGKASIIVKVLDIVDNFEMAIESLKESENNELKKGIEMIFTNLHKFLEEEGIKAIKAEGNKFDPYQHEVMKVENSENDNIVLKELQKGYTLNNKVIRTSKVVLSKSEAK